MIPAQHNRKGGDRAPPWLLPRAALLLGTLVAVNPVALLALSESGAVTAGVVVAAVLILQAAYKQDGSPLLLGYAINFLLLASVLFHAEYFYRALLSHRAIPNIYEVERGYSFNLPLLDMTFEDVEYRAAYVTNIQGFRIGEVVDPAQPITSADWVFVGDSFTQGAQVPFDALYTSVLYREFPDKGIVNLGASGLGVAEELELYRAHGAPLGPTTVFLQVSPFNDFMNVEPRRSGMSESLMVRSTLYRTLMYQWRFEDPRSLPLGRWTEPFYPGAEANRRFNVFYRETTADKDRDLELFTRYLREFRDAVEGNGARFVVVLLPTREQVSDAALAEVIGAFSIDPADLNMLRPNELVASVGLELGIQVIDLLPWLAQQGSSAFFDGDEHLTPQGHAAVAEGIAEAITPWSAPSSLREIAVPVDSARYPRVACGGTKLSFQAPVRGLMEVFSANLSDGGMRQLTFDGVPKSHPTLSADCERLLYTQGDAKDMRTEVVLVELLTGRTFVLTAGEREYGAIATFSSDDRYVAFVEWRELEIGGSLTNPVIVVLDLESNQKRYVTDGSHESWRPVFSPDGQRLAYIAKPSGQFDVYEAEISTGKVLQLTATSYDEWDPTYSQSGELVVYASQKDGNWDLFAMATKTGEEQRLTLTSGDEWDPVFGPGDQSVLFATQFGMFAGIYTMPFSTQE